MAKYAKFAAMVATSTAVMFGLMYLTSYPWSHIYFSETRAWLALVMDAAMGVTMLRIYANRRINAAICAGCAAVCIGVLWLVRSQV